MQKDSMPIRKDGMGVNILEKSVTPVNFQIKKQYTGNLLVKKVTAGQNIMLTTV